MKEFKLSIYTPEKTVFEGNVISLIAPAQMGYLGVLADHAPLIVSLKHGDVTFRKNSGEAVKISISRKGFLEVDRNKATILLTTS